MKLCTLTMASFKKFCFLALALPATIACNSDERQTNLDAPGSFLFDHEWNYVETRVLLRDGATLPFPSDRKLLNKIRYPEGDVPPSGDALTGSDILFDLAGVVKVKLPDSNQFEDYGTRFRVVDERLMRASVRKSIWFKYEYDFDRNDGSLILAPEEKAAGALTGMLNNLYSKILFSGALDSTASKLTEILFEDPRVQDALEEYLYEGIRGRLEEIPEQDPEDVSRKLAQAIVQLLQEQDIEGIVEAALVQRLKELTDLDPESTAKEMASKIAKKIELAFSEERIIEVILPRLEEMKDNAEAVAAGVSEVLYQALTSLLSEERISAIVESVWVEFADIAEVDIVAIAGELATVIVDNWLNPETLSNALLPFAQRIEATPVRDIPALAEEAIAELQRIVDGLNEKFPDLNLSPDWSEVSRVVTAAFVGAKGVIGADGAQDFADDLGILLADSIFSHEKIEGAATKALLALQEIDPAVAGQKIGTWLAELLSQKETEITQSLAARLEAMIDALDAKDAASTIAEIVHDKIVTRLDEEALYERLLPILEKLTQIDPEGAAAFLIDLLQDAELLSKICAPDKPPLPTCEDLLADYLQEILEDLLPLDKDAIAHRLVQLITESDLLTEILTEERVDKLIKFALYRRVLERAKNLNSIQRIELELQAAD